MRPADDIIAELDEIATADSPWRSDRFFSYIFNASDEVVRLGHEAHRRFSGANGLDPTVFTSFVRFEHDLVAFCRDLVGGDDQVQGTFTSGGTESILLAVKAARDARRVDLGDELARVNMVLPDSAHAAFHKAGAYFDVEVRQVPARADLRADPEAMLAATDDHTAIVVTSAPQFAHGVVDPIAEIAAMTRERDLWLHVDACMGGLVLPFIADSPPFGFEVDGVTSMSLDLHKYGYTTKGASVALYRDAARRRHQFSGTAEWTGYPLVNTTMQSTKSGGPLAAAWAVVQYLGRDGYQRLVDDAHAATLRLAEFVTDHADLELTAWPDATLLAMVTADHAAANVFGLADAMRDRGWKLSPTPHYGTSPAHLHLTMTATHLGVIDELTADFDAAMAEGRAPTSLLGGDDGVAELGPDDFAALLAAVDLEADRAAIDATLDTLPPRLRERALETTFDDIFTT